MEKEFRNEAGRQYLKYFKIWFIVVGVLVVFTAIFFVCNQVEKDVVRSNTQAPAERVYDQAEVLTEA